MTLVVYWMHEGALPCPALLVPYRCEVLEGSVERDEHRNLDDGGEAACQRIDLCGETEGQGRGGGRA